jgi:protein-disulfide isomerase
MTTLASKAAHLRSLPMRLTDSRLVSFCWTLMLAAPVNVLLAATVPTPATASAPAPYAGLTLGLTPDGALSVGDPGAPLTMEEWTDYACPFCARHFQAALPRLIEDYVRAGKLRLVLRDFPLEALHPGAPRAHTAARCVAQQDVAKGWAMHDALFTRQKEWSQKPDPAPVLESMATGVGANVAAYLACIGEAKSKTDVAASVAEGKAHGFTGTPSFRFAATSTMNQARATAATAGASNSSPSSATSTASSLLQFSGALPADDFTEIIDALLAGRDPPVDPGLQGLAPFWARAEGLAFDQARPGFTKAGDPVQGKPTAKTYVVEFVDYESAGSRRHHAQAQPALDAKWVDTGQVAWVTKNLPMRVHKQSPLAAVAAVCAAQQGKLREMQGQLFGEQARWAANGDAAEAALMELAARAQLELPRFKECYASRDAMAKVLRDVQDARGVADRAPSFVLLTAAPGGAVTGPVPLDEFNRLLEKTVSGTKATANNKK